MNINYLKIHNIFPEKFIFQEYCSKPGPGICEYEAIHGNALSIFSQKSFSWIKYNHFYLAIQS